MMLEDNFEVFSQASSDPSSGAAQFWAQGWWLAPG